MQRLADRRAATRLTGTAVLLLAAGWAAAAIASAPHPAPAGKDGGMKQDGSTRGAPAPSPDLTPDQVVRIQLDAMKHNDDPAPDSGIATAFKFASPGNQAQTGPLDRFIGMVKNPVYAPMINSRSIEYAKAEVHDDQAQQVVKITAADGNAAYFVFILRKQADGQYKECWMTEGVARVQPPDADQSPAPQPGNNGDGRQKA